MASHGCMSKQIVAGPVLIGINLTPDCCNAAERCIFDRTRRSHVAASRMLIDKMNDDQ